MVVTEELLERGKSIRGGWSREQFHVLGIDFPPSKGWKKSILGEYISEIDANFFVELKDAHSTRKDGNT